MRNEIVSMSQVCDKHKTLSGHSIHLSYRELMESKTIILVSYLTGVMHTAKISNVKIILHGERMIDGKF